MNKLKDFSFIFSLKDCIAEVSKLISRDIIFVTIASSAANAADIDDVPDIFTEYGIRR